MAALYAIWKPLSQVRLDGVNYNIGAKEREDGRFSVSWVCLKCCEQGPPAPAAATLERAVAFAHIGLRAHHAFIHRHAPVITGSNGSAGHNSGLNLPPCEPSERCQAAYECAKAVFDKLCTAHAKARSCSAQAQSAGDPTNSFAAACRDWNAIAHDFQEALDAYLHEANSRAT